jgi:hypothetical protein
MKSYPLAKDALNIDSTNNGFIGLLSAIIGPDEDYMVIVEKENQINTIIHDILSIGYENNLR